MNEHYEKWSRLSLYGLLLIGGGASVLGHAAWLKGNRSGFWRWFFYGLVGLVALNAGASVFGDAVKHRTLYEVALRELTQ